MVYVNRWIVSKSSKEKVTVKRVRLLITHVLYSSEMYSTYVLQYGIVIVSSDIAI